MPDLDHLIAMRDAAAGAWDSFAGWGDWRQRGDRMVSPSGKRSLTLEAFQRLKGRAPKEKPAPAPKQKGAKSGTVPKGQPKPGEAEKILTAKARVARESYEAALKADPQSPELGNLKRRADAAAAELKAGPKPSPTLSVASLPPVQKEAAAVLSRTPGAAAPVSRSKVDTSATGPNKKAVKADPYGVIRRTPTTVQGKPVVAVGQTNRAGEAAAKLRAGQKPQPPVPPKPDGSPDLPALRKAVDDGVTTSRAQNWGYDFTKARSVLADAGQQIAGFARKNPAKAIALAREVTGDAKVKTAEDAARALKKWVGETVELLSREPGKGVSKNSERGGRVEWFAEVAPRMGGMRALVAALAV